MPRIHLLSDLHCEFAPFGIPEGIDADFTVLAGDICNSARLHPWGDAAGTFGRSVVMVAGNHDFWGSTIDGGLAEMREAAAAGGAFFLENDAIVLCGSRLLGCTLWTDYRLGSDHPEQREWQMAECARSMNDHRRIGVAAEGNAPFQPRHAEALHLASAAWLDAELAKPFPGPTVVVTHHCPSLRCIDPRLFDAVSSAFASDLEQLVLRRAPDLWICGHTHHNVDFRVGRTRVLSNQRGYASTAHPPAGGFDPRAVVVFG